MKKHFNPGISLPALIAFVICACTSGSFAQESVAQEDDACDSGTSASGHYTFSWSLQQTCSLSPRGGTSRGTPVSLDPEPYSGWQALQEDGLSDFEKDRRAILAMAGPYRSSFEFLEVLGYTPDFKRAAPYQSWSTEYIYVLADEEDFISLQHIIVMFIQTDDGEVRGPFVQKHWRQDWAFEKNRILEYAGNNFWQWREPETAKINGTWAQSVYQVDDSPRYESFGQWQHYENFSTWKSAETWRPLPRRESSVRDDYQVLIGTNRHTITPDGWVHEEENYKVRLNADDDSPGSRVYLAKELGLNRYERIIDFDFSSGAEYWQRTEEYWRTVRAVWEELLASQQVLEIKTTVNDLPLFGVLFEEAGNYSNYSNNPAMRSEQETAIRAVINSYIE